MHITINGRKIDISGTRTLSYPEIVLLAISGEGFPNISVESSNHGDDRSEDELARERAGIEEDEKLRLREKKDGLGMLSMAERDFLLGTDDDTVKEEVDKIMEARIQKRTRRWTRNVLPDETIRVSSDKKWNFEVDIDNADRNGRG